MQSLDLTNGNGVFDDMLPAKPQQKTLDIEIDPPVVINEITYDVLHLKEPTFFQREDAEQEMAASTSIYAYRKFQARLVSNVTGIQLAIVKRMPFSKVVEAADFLIASAPGGPATTES